MALRTSWKGFLRLSLVSVPVRAYSSATTGDGRVHLNQLHANCHRRIRYQKVCPVHGEVSANEIVSGYEYAKGQYVVINSEDLDKLRTESEKAIQLDRFVPLDAIDPLYYDGRSYYLLPDGPGGNKPYAVLSRAMQDAGKCAIANVLVTGRDQLAELRSLNGLLTMSILSYEAQLKKPETFHDELPDAKVSSDELRLARMLVEETSADQVDWSRYKDSYTEKLVEIIEAKVAGEEIVAPPKEEEAPIINLMDALRESVARAKGDVERRPPRKVAASKRRAAAPTERKRKTS
jgi:DNA end-binding protein Ku